METSHTCLLNILPVNFGIIISEFLHVFDHSEIFTFCQCFIINI